MVGPGYAWAKGWEIPDGESVSPNESEPDSASLHHLQVAILPEMEKPVTDEEETSRCTRRT
jgi:hypothetical protein